MKTRKKRKFKKYIFPDLLEANHLATGCKENWFLGLSFGQTQLWCTYPNMILTRPKKFVFYSTSVIWTSSTISPRNFTRPSGEWRTKSTRLTETLARLVVGQRIWTLNLVLKSSNLTHSTMPSNDLVLMHNETLKTNVKENLWQQVTRIHLLSLRLTGSISVLWYSFPWVWQEATQQFSSRLEQSRCRTQVMEQ